MQPFNMKYLRLRHSGQTPVGTLSSRVGDAKLNRGEAALPDFYAAAKPDSVSDNGRRSSVTVLIAPSPYILEKIGHKTIYGAKSVGLSRFPLPKNDRGRSQFLRTERKPRNPHVHGLCWRLTLCSSRALQPLSRPLFAILHRHLVCVGKQGDFHCPRAHLCNPGRQRLADLVYA